MDILRNTIGDGFVVFFQRWNRIAPALSSLVEMREYAEIDPELLAVVRGYWNQVYDLGDRLSTGIIDESARLPRRIREPMERVAASIRWAVTLGDAAMETIETGEAPAGLEEPTGLGSLRALKGFVDSLVRIIKALSKAAKPLAVGFGIMTAAILGSWVVYRKFIISDVDRSMENLEGATKVNRLYQEAIAKCEGDPACIAEVERLWNPVVEAFMKRAEGGEDECGITDTPEGSLLGVIVGLIGGVVAVDAVVKG